MCNVDKYELIFGLKKDYEDDFKMVFLCVCGILKD